MIQKKKKNNKKNENVNYTRKCESNELYTKIVTT